MDGMTGNLMITVLAVCFGTQFQFYNVVVGNNMASVSKRWFNQSYAFHYDRILSDNEFSLIYALTTSCLQIGAVVSSLWMKILAEWLGRRRTLILTGFLEALGASLVGLSELATSVEMLAFGRFVIGLGFGAGMGVASMFISELAPVKIRGKLGTIQQVFIGLGMTTGFMFTLPQFFGTDALWPIAVAIPGIPGLIQSIVLWFTYDSPKYLLLTKRDKNAALKSLQFYKGHAQADDALVALERDQIAAGKPITFAHVLTKRIYRKPLIISFCLMFSVQFTGIAPIMSFSKTIFNDAGLDEQASELASMGLGIMNLISPFVVLILVEKSGRRLLLLCGLALAFFALLITTVLIELKDKLGVQILVTVSIPFVYIFQIGYAVTSSVSWIIPSEMFPQNVRSYGVAVCCCSFFVSQLITVLGYLPLKEAAGVPVSMAPFLVGTILFFFVFFYYVPETKGVSPEKFILEANERSRPKLRATITPEVQKAGELCPANLNSDEA